MSNYQLIKNTEWKEVEINGEDKEIPVNWEIKKIHEVAKVISGQSPEMQNINEKNGIDFHQGNTLFSSKFIKSSFKKIPKEKAKKIAPINSILISVRAPVGEVNITQNEVAIGRGLSALVPNIEINYLINVLRLNKDNIAGLGNGSTFEGMKISEFSDFEFSYSPNQSAIASILSEQESVIENIEQLIQKYESRFQYLSDELLSGRLRVKEVDGEMVLYKNPDDNWKEVEINGEMKEIPSDWSVKTVKEFISYMSEGGTPPTSDKSFYDNGKIPWVVVEDIKQNIIETKKYINEKGLRKIGNKLWEAGDIIMSTGATIGVVGKVGVPLATKQGVSGFKVNTKEILSDYLYYLFKNSTELFLKVSNGSTFKSLPQKDIKVLEFFYPKQNEQNLIVKILNEQEEIINEQKEILNQEKQKFDWLLDNLLSGKYLIKNIN